MIRKSLLIALVLAMSLSVFSVYAISNGEPDGDRHPMVGALFADFTGDGVITGNELICSGSYAGPSKDGNYDVFLTAGHCLAIAPVYGITQFFVSFDNEVLDEDGPTGVIPSMDFQWDPEFGHDSGNLHDSGVVLLPPGSVTGIPAVQLPPAGYLDSLMKAAQLKDLPVEVVGYGNTAIWKQPGGTQFVLDGVRKMAYTKIKGLTKSWVLYNQNVDATDLGGVCFGDSGSAQFIAGTTMVISTTSGGDVNCRSHNYDYRLDTDSARNFLGQFLELP